MNKFESFIQKERKPNKTEKYQKAQNEVELLADKLGFPIDEKIKETITILRSMDFPTTSSCGGHLSTEAPYNKVGFPYVEIYMPCEEGWQLDKEKRKRCREQIMPYGLQIEKYLKEFYENRGVDEFERIGFFSMLPQGFRIQSMGVEKKPEELGINTLEDFDSRIKAYQEEMQLFTEFLKEKYFKS